MKLRTSNQARKIAGQFILANWHHGSLWDPVKWPFSGYIFHREDLSSISETRHLLTRIDESYRQAHLPSPWLVVTEEGGIVHRFSYLAPPPSPYLTGTLDPASAYEIGYSVGQMLAVQGLNWNMAPVLDFYVPRNKVVGTRAFGNESNVVSMMASSWMNGHRAAGIPVVVKHFPGHGHALDDSHVDTPIRSESLQSCKPAMAPFEYMLSQGAEAVMTAHIRFPAVDSDPVTVSKVWVTDILRNHLRYQGLVVTDALSMQGIRALLSPADAAVRALNAGVDVIDCGGDDRVAEEVLDAVAWAIDHDVIPQWRLDESTARIYHLKSRIRVPNDWPSMTTLDEITSTFSRYVKQGLELVRGELADFSVSNRRVWVSPQSPLEVQEKVAQSRLACLSINDPKVWTSEARPTSEHLIVFTENIWKSPQIVQRVKRLCIQKKVLHVAVLDPLDTEELPEAQAAINLRGNPYYARTLIAEVLEGSR